MSSALRDESWYAVLCGLIVPILLVLVVIANFATGVVVLPADRRSELLGYFRDFGRFAGAVTVKIGLAVAAHGWFWLANDDRRERRAVPVTLCGLLLISAGLGAIAVGYFLNPRF